MIILELASQVGINPKWVASTHGGEYHSECPNCGGTDRFYIQPNRQMKNCIGYFGCRQCGIRGDSIQFAREFLKLSFAEAAIAVKANINKYPTLFSLRHTLKPATLQKPPAKWITKATWLVDKSHARIAQQPTILKYLDMRGLPWKAIELYKIGWSDKNEFLIRTDWGLDEKFDQNGNKKKLWIPAGLVIPTYSNNEVVRLKVRRNNWVENDKLPKYIAISGSMNGLNLIGNTSNTSMIVVESELDAYAVNYATKDFAFVVAIGSNIKDPDNVSDYYAKKAKNLLICYDNDEAGKKMLNKWKKLYPHAIGYPTPVGKDIGEAIQNGFNIREWFLKIINP